MTPISFIMKIDTTNVQFPPYCYLRPDTKTYIGLSEEGKESVKDIMSRMASKTITPAQATAEGKKNVITGEARKFYDWNERSKRIREMLNSDPADVILLQEVNKASGNDDLSTLDDIFQETNFEVAKYSVFTLQLENPDDQPLENILKRGTAVALGKSAKMQSCDSIELTLAKNGGKKIQTRAASVVNFTTNVLGRELKVRAVSVHITGFWSKAASNLKDIKGKIEKIGDADPKLSIQYGKAILSFEEFVEQCQEGNNELRHYLKSLEMLDACDITLVGGDFNFDPLSGDGVVEAESLSRGLRPLSTCQDQIGILQEHGYMVDESKTTSQGGERRLDYVAIKLGDRVRDLFDVKVKSHNLENKTGGFVSDHSFVRTELEFSLKNSI